MQILIDFIAGIGDMLYSCFGWLISTVRDLAYIAKLLGTFVGNIPSYFAWLPDEALATLVTIFAIVIIYKLLGREG